jgi:hypothetical protein
LRLHPSDLDTEYNLFLIPHISIQYYVHNEWRNTKEGTLQNRTNWRTLRVRMAIVFLEVSQVRSSRKIARKDSFIKDVFAIDPILSKRIHDPKRAVKVGIIILNHASIQMLCTIPVIRFLNSHSYSIRMAVEKWGVNASLRSQVSIPRATAEDLLDWIILIIAWHILEIVRNKLDVICDSGIRTGSGAIKALALAPRCVLVAISSLPTYSCTFDIHNLSVYAIAGKVGVKQVLRYPRRS